MIPENEEVLCKIECDRLKSGKRSKGDTVTLTKERLYKTGIDMSGQRMHKAVNVDRISAVASGKERNVWYLVLGLLFLALSCVLAAYCLPGGKLRRFIAGIVVLAIGAAVMIFATIAYFRFSIRYVTVYFDGGKIRIASAGLSEEDATDFAAQVLKAAQAARQVKNE